MDHRTATGDGEAARESVAAAVCHAQGKDSDREYAFCAIELTGVSGEPVDYRLHEVLQAVEPASREQEGR